MIMNAHGHGPVEDPTGLAAANEDFPEDIGEFHFFIPSSWDPYAAWRARVKATFCVENAGAALPAT